MTAPAAAAVRPATPTAAGLQPATFDAAALQRLKARAGTDPKAAVREAAKQFETLFMQEMLKSMRSATLSSGLWDNETSKMGTEMLDAQYAASASGRPGGLADLLARQLERQMGLAAPELKARSGDANAAQTNPLTAPTGAPRIPEQRAAAFIERHRAAAERSAAGSGLAAPFMLAQAGHETGWGTREIRHADGSNSYNLFGIKAGAGWNGAVAEVTTTEFLGGVATKLKQRFRAYASYDEAFADYARLVNGSPRYREAAQAAQAGGDARRFAQGLQQGGYATDPAYAGKIERAIATTLRLQRAQG